MSCKALGMWRPRPGRLKHFDYRGYHRYFLTLCTAGRLPAFTQPRAVSGTLSQLRRLSAEEQFAILAYCFMPDHLHLLLAGAGEDSCLPRLISRFKQASGFCYRQVAGHVLWQSGYFDRVLRNEEATLAACRYVLGNPVRAGLAGTLGEYPYAGSDVYRLEDIAE
jgi:putative transposase